MAADARDDGLTRHFGADKAAELRLWAEGLNRQIECPAAGWTAKGYSGAKLVAVTLRASSGPPKPQRIIVKLCPARPYSQEGRRHRAAVDSSAAFAEEHLVDLPYDPYRCRDGTLLLFQGIAGGSLLRSQPLSQLTQSEMIRSCPAVIRGVIGWTGESLGVSREITVADYLRLELRDSFGQDGAVRRAADAAGLLRPSADPLLIPEDGTVPNPLLMATGDSVTVDCRLQYLYGRSHGDLHGGNALIPRSEHGRLEPDRFRLVDLSMFDERAPLSRDAAMLAVATLCRQAARLPDSQRTALLRYLLSRDSAATEELTGHTKRLVDAVLDLTGTPIDANGWRDTWDLQFLLSLQATALVHSLFESLGAKARWWCFRLAAGAGARLLDQLNLAHGHPRRPWGNPLPVDPSVLGSTAARTAVAAVARHARPREGGRRRSLSAGEMKELIESAIAIHRIAEPGVCRAVLTHLPRPLLDLPPGYGQRDRWGLLFDSFVEHRRLEPWSRFVMALREELGADPALIDFEQTVRRLGLVRFG